MSRIASRAVPPLALVLLVAGAVTQAQHKRPRASPRAAVMQTVGTTQVTIDYGRPGVKGREIWGKLVPYGKVWRTGADENTTLTLGNEMKVAGHLLPAGSYGLHTIPGKETWTIILSHNSESWGSYGYKREEDALRFEVTPETASHQERLLFLFEDLTMRSARVVMRWKELSLSFPIEEPEPDD